MLFKGPLFCVVALATMLMGCADYGSFVADAAINPPEVERLRSTSGTEFEVFHIDTQPNPAGAIFFVTGSGCASLRYYLRHYFAGFPGSWRIFALQKAGVSPLSTGMGCSREFDAQYTLPEILTRNREALSAVIARQGKVDVLFGVSEGGDVAAALAGENPSVGRLVVIGSGGMSVRESLRVLARRSELPVSSEQLDESFEQIAAEPASVDKRLLGLPFRYWSSTLDVDPSPLYRRISQPTYVLFGEKDQSVPVESVEKLRDDPEIRKHGKITVEIVPGASHTLNRSGVDLKPELFTKINAWLTSR
jgi:pimeloyl-ACP methyl ester carboxylesterase